MSELGTNTYITNLATKFTHWVTDRYSNHFFGGGGGSKPAICPCWITCESRLYTAGLSGGRFWGRWWWWWWGGGRLFRRCDRYRIRERVDMIGWRPPPRKCCSIGAEWARSVYVLFSSTGMVRREEIRGVCGGCEYEERGRGVEG